MFSIARNPWCQKSGCILPILGGEHFFNARVGGRHVRLLLLFRIAVEDVQMQERPVLDWNMFYGATNFGPHSISRYFE